jgi:hypothetical protein
VVSFEEALECMLNQCNSRRRLEVGGLFFGEGVRCVVRPHCVDPVVGQRSQEGFPVPGIFNGRVAFQQGAVFFIVLGGEEQVIRRPRR